MKTVYIIQIRTKPWGSWTDWRDWDRIPPIYTREIAEKEYISIVDERGGPYSHFRLVKRTVEEEVLDSYP